MGNNGVILTVDTSRFTRALREYAATTKKDGDEIVNTAAKHLCYRAVQTTQFANKSEIEALRQVSSVVVFGKRGQKLKDFTASSLRSQRKRTNYAATSKGFMIYLASLRKRGKSPAEFSSRKTLEAGALKMIGARLRAVNYLRSGWLTAAKSLVGVRSTGAVSLPGTNPAPGGSKKSTGGKASAMVWNAALYNKFAN